MRDRWNDSAPASASPLDECVYGSRALGSDPTAVLHGGGNTSIKIDEPDLHGRMRRILYVKGSGMGLDVITRAGFAPLVLDEVLALTALDSLSDTEMMNALRTASIRADAPVPSVEAILHAVIPNTAVQHSHPDAVLAVTNTADGAARARELYGDEAIIVPYVMPGFLLAKAAAKAVAEQWTPESRRMVLLNHGLFTFAETTQAAYADMVEMITMAEEYLTSKGEPVPAERTEGDPGCPVCDSLAVATLRHDLSAAAGRPLLVRQHTDDASWRFTQRADIAEISQQGPATPDHVLFTKRLPMLGRDVGAYARDYAEYFDANRGERALTMLDPAPRIVIDPELGLLSVGRDVAAQRAAGDIYEHTITVIERAERIGGYRALPAQDIFDLEYWELEQAKLGRTERADQEFRGEVALVTGAASGIGKACAAELLRRGAAVVGFDIAGTVTSASDAPGYLGVVCDVSDVGSLREAIDRGVARFGGVDMLVAAAGLFPVSAPIAAAARDAWRRALDVNATGLVDLLALVHPLLRLAPRRGRVVVIGSKNVHAPGPGASAYSASKAAANQIARVAALEWAADGIRVNSVHPDAVFDTGLWTPELLAERAARYGMTIDEYKRRNLLGTEITSDDVAAIVARLLGPEFATVTGAHLPIDGGNDRVI